MLCTNWLWWTVQLFICLSVYFVLFLVPVFFQKEIHPDPTDFMGRQLSLSVLVFILGKRQVNLPFWWENSIFLKSNKFLFWRMLVLFLFLCLSCLKLSSLYAKLQCTWDFKGHSIGLPLKNYQACSKHAWQNFKRHALSTLLWCFKPTVMLLTIRK